MAKRKNKQVIDFDKLRDIDAYDHAAKQRANNPPIGVAKDDDIPETKKTYVFDPNLDPSLEWAGKKEGLSFDVDTCAIHIHESIKPTKLLQNVMMVNKDDKDLHGQGYLFPEYDPIQRMRTRNLALEYYQHGVDWTNRLIAGDSVTIMNSFLEKEGMAGQVQMVYFDPPYGIKYSSNFQPFTNKRDVKDGNDDDLSSEPEMIKAFRDTWELGIHSYLTYIRNNLLMVHELLSVSGSVFIQISNDNVHHIREICDEIFGPDNFCGQIVYTKSNGLESKLLNSPFDFIIWYAKDKSCVKFHKLYLPKTFDGGTANNYIYLELSNGIRRGMTQEEKKNKSLIPSDAKIFQTGDLTSQGNVKVPIIINGKKYIGGWKTTVEGMLELARKNRIYYSKNSIMYVRYMSDFPYVPITLKWDDTSSSFMERKYVVQTSPKAIQRCMLMTTDPDDLVLDITCGSGTTAYVAEQWGRRWITCDTSRIALELAKERIMTATYDYYKLAIPEQGIASGFVYKTVPHITLKSIANNLLPDEEILYDQPEIDKTKVRVSGPFTVESLPAPIVKPISELDVLSTEVLDKDRTKKLVSWREELFKTGIVTHGKDRIQFIHLEPLQDLTFFQAEGETSDGKRAVVCFGSEDNVMDARYVNNALLEVDKIFPKPHYVIFAAFQFGPEAMALIGEAKYSGITILEVQMNTDLMTKDLKKKQSSSQSFLMVGQPDVMIIKHGSYKDTYKVIVNGFDYFNTKTGELVSGGANDIAMWMLDIDYDGLCIEPEQVFFPMGGTKGGWNKLAKTLNAEIDQEKIQKFAGNESLWFNAKENESIAVKIIDNRGVESMVVKRVGE